MWRRANFVFVRPSGIAISSAVEGRLRLSTAGNEENSPLSTSRTWSLVCDVAPLLPLESTRASSVFAAQPYQTLAGPALSVTFDAASESVRTLQDFGVFHPAVPILYHHNLVENLAEFCETKRETHRSHGREAAVLVEPMKDFWERVGTLSCTYFSRHRRQPSVNHQGKDHAVTLRPVHGSVELIHSSHRQGRLLDVRSSLFDERHQPLSTIVLTGDRHDPEGGGLLTTLVTQEDLDKAASASDRRSLFSQAALREHLQRHDAMVENVLQGTSGTALPADRVLLSSEVLRMGDETACSGFAAVVSWLSAEEGAAPQQSGTEPRSEKDDEKLAAAVPPWLITCAVQRFANRVIPGAGAFDAVPSKDGDWLLVAYHCDQDGDVVVDLPAELVCGPLKAFASYHLPPWRHRTGLPQLNGEPCVAMTAEVRQLNRVVVRGVYYFTLERCWR